MIITTTTEQLQKAEDAKQTKEAQAKRERAYDALDRMSRWS